MELPVDYTKLTGYKRRLVREEYVRVQKGLCHYCHAPLTGMAAPKVAIKKVNRKLYPFGFFNNPVHLHHHHTTGMTIGAVHCHCNAVLWEYHDE